MRMSLKVLLLALVLCFGGTAQQRRQEVTARRPVKEVNQIAMPGPNDVVAIVGATLIDGRGGAPVQDAAVIVQGGRITQVGPRASVRIPAGAEVFKANG